MLFKRRLPPAGTRLDISQLTCHLYKLIRNNDIDSITDEAATYLNCRNVFAVSQGRVALTIILKELMKSTNRNKVIIPAYTCYTVPASIVRSGLRIIPNDISVKHLDYDYDKLNEIDCSDVLAILSSNLYGIVNNLEKLEIFAKKNNIYLIDDAAQAFGAKYNNRYVGTYGDVGFYSLSKGKSFTTLEGGLIVTNNDDLAKNIKENVLNIPNVSKTELIKDVLKLLCYSIFFNPYLYWVPESIPSLNIGKTIFDPYFSIKKYNDVFSYLGAYFIKKIDEINEERIGKAMYIKNRLHAINNVEVILGYENSKSIYLRLPILINNANMRGDIFNILKNNGLGVSHVISFNNK